MLQVFQLFLTYVACVSSGSCKSRLGYCTCCNGYICMFQVYIPNILAVSDVCCKCFIWMLHMLQWLYTYVTSVWSKYFICFRRMLQQVLHVVNVSWVGAGSERRQRLSSRPQAVHTERCGRGATGAGEQEGRQAAAGQLARASVQTSGR
jgi:hypothetical protein